MSFLRLRSSHRVNVVVCLVAVCGLSTATYAANTGEVEVLGANVAPSWMYTGSSTYEWNVPVPNDPANVLTNGSVVERVTDPLDTPDIWWIAPTFIGAPAAELDWHGSYLDQDLSVNGMVHGTFLPGGTMVITGKIYDGSLTEVFDGVLLEASVSAFEIIEENDTDVLTFVDQTGRITPTGGFLVTNNLGLRMVGDYYFDGKVSAAQENGDGVDSLEGNIVTTAAHQFNLVQVPEPASVLLLAAGLMLVGRRSRRS